MTSKKQELLAHLLEIEKANSKQYGPFHLFAFEPSREQGGNVVHISFMAPSQQDFEDRVSGLMRKLGNIPEEAIEDGELGIRLYRPDQREIQSVYYIAQMRGGMIEHTASVWVESMQVNDLPLMPPCYYITAAPWEFDTVKEIWSRLPAYKRKMQAPRVIAEPETPPGEAKPASVQASTSTEALASPSKALVIVPPVRMEGRHMSVASNAIDRRMLRYAALYWDWIRVPLPLGPTTDSEEDFLLLESEGFLHPVLPPREMIVEAKKQVEGPKGSDPLSVQIDSWMALGSVTKHIQELDPGGAAVDPSRDVVLVMAALLEAFSVLEKDGTYTAGHFGPTHPNVVGDGRALEFKLYRGMDVPTDAPMQDVLEFRHANRQALIDLRGYMDGLHAQVLASPDQNWSHNAALRQLKDAAIALDAEMNKTGWALWRSEVSVQFHVSSAIVAAIAAVFGRVDLAAAAILAPLTDFLTLNLSRDPLQRSSAIDTSLAYYLKSREL